MRRSLILWFSLVMLPAARLCGHEPESLPAVELPPLVPVPATVGRARDSAPHLLEAANHLQAAGLKDAADRLRAMARERSHREHDATRKDGELQCLLEKHQPPLDESSQPCMVLVRATAIEFSRAALGHQAGELDRILGFSQRGTDVPPIRQQSIDKRVGDGGGDYVFVPKTGAAGEVGRFPGSGVSRQASADLGAGNGTTRTNHVVDGNPTAHPLFRELREKNLIRLLAEPVLVTTSGRPASLHSGGQYPQKVAAPANSTHIRMVPFGVQMDVVPTVMAGRRVRTQIRLEISESDSGSSVLDGADRVFGLITRSINTEVELAFGQTAVFASIAASAPREPLSRRGSAASAPGADPRSGAPSRDDQSEIVAFITIENLSEPLPPRMVELIPTEIGPDELRQLLTPLGVPDDVHYFPASPIPRKGTLR